jgi:two-component system LytT family response regulator
VIQVKDIIRCQANDNLTDFFMADGYRILICRTLKFYEDVLSDFDFLRVHKSHLVNLHRVKKYLKGKGGQVMMTDGSVVDVSPQKTGPAGPVLRREIIDGRYETGAGLY